MTLHDPAIPKLGASARAFRARAVRRDTVRLGTAPVRRAADVHQDGAAEARRCAVRVVGRDGVLSGSAADRLRLRASARAHAQRRAGGAGPSRGAGGRGADPADRDRARFCRAALGRHRAVARRPVRRLDRIAVRRAVGERAAPAKLVRRKRPPAGAQPLCALCGFEPRLLRGAARLSARTRVAADLARASLDLVGRVCRSRDPHRGGRHDRGARRERSRDGPCEIGRAGNATRPRRLDGACGDSRPAS